MFCKCEQLVISLFFYSGLISTVWPLRGSFHLKNSLKNFRFVTKIFVLIVLMLCLILEFIFMVFELKVDNFINLYCYLAIF